jgi:hypothetical protein
MRRLWTCIPGSTAILTALIVALAATSALAHEGHPHDDGRIPGQPDFQRIGTHEFEFHPKARAYTHKRSPNGVPLWVHVDDFAPSGFVPGALIDLPTSTEQPVCATSGHRIKVAYAETYLEWKSSEGGMTVPEREAIRNAVLRMTWKIKNESLRSSDGQMALRMRVDCDGLGQINVYYFYVLDYPYNNPFNVWAKADDVLGKPGGADSIKHLIFFDGPGPAIDGGTASGFGESAYDSLKSSSDAGGGNYNRIVTESAVIYNPGWPDSLGYWDSHVTLHELFHTMGAVQSYAPFATGAKHCTDGIDVMCYPDQSPEGPTYTESRCPFPDYATPIGTPLDCEYNTYFDAGEESKEWLNTNWNVGGAENPFLAQFASPSVKYELRDTNSGGPPDYAFSLTSQQTGDLPISGDWNGDGFDTIGFYRPSNGSFYLRNSNSSGPPDIVFPFGTAQDRPVAGDWNEDGIDTIGFYRPSNGSFYLSNSNKTGCCDYQFPYGNNEDLPIAGDWNNSGTDTIGLYRPSTGVFYLSNTNAQVPPSYSFAYGNPGNDDLPVAGDWDENGYFSIGVFRQSVGTWFQDNEVPGNQPISYVYSFGPIGHTIPIVGDWNNSGTDTPGAAWK